jgi:hypothetical protein
MDAIWGLRWDQDHQGTPYRLARGFFEAGQVGGGSIPVEGGDCTGRIVGNCFDVAE